MNADNTNIFICENQRNLREKINPLNSNDNLLSLFVIILTKVAIKKLKEKLLSVSILFISLVVTAIVAFILFIPQTGALGELNVSFLPGLNAAINSVCTVLLLVGFLNIKKMKVQVHKTCMLTAFALSSCFLISYLVYHIQAPPTHYGGEGVLKYIYFFILITHICLATIILPLILFTFTWALKNNFAKHRKIAKWTLPLWLYVTVTGVIIYVMISPYYT